jgi:hypothetical protein
VEKWCRVGVEQVNFQWPVVMEVRRRDHKLLSLV